MNTFSKCDLAQWI